MRIDASQQYGINQVYGRTEVRAESSLAENNSSDHGYLHDVVNLCPDAWVFNYSNPMTAITTTVLRKHPQLKFVGMCHEIASLERYLPSILNTPSPILSCAVQG